MPLSIAVADKGYDDEGNHVLVNERRSESVQLHSSKVHTDTFFQYGEHMTGTGNR